MKDRLQLRFDHYTGYTSKDEIREKIEELRNDPMNPLPWALKGEPIVFFYKETGDTGYTAVLAIGVEGDGTTPNRKNDYFLIDAGKLEKDLADLAEETAANIGDISGMTELLETLVSSLGLREDGTIDWHRHHSDNPLSDDMGRMYPDAIGTDLYNLIWLMAKELKGNLNGDLSLEYDAEDGVIWIISNGEKVGEPILTSDFVKDGMIEKVDVINDESERQRDPDGHAVEVPYIVFYWNNAVNNDPTRIPLGKIFNPYTNGDGLNLNGNEFSIKIDSGNSESFISVERGGLKVTGIQEAINAAAAAATTEVTDDGVTRFVTVSSRTDSDGHKIYIIKENDIASANGLSEEIDNRIASDAVLGNRVSSAETKIETLTESVNSLSESASTLNAVVTGLTSGYTNLSAYTFNNVSQLAHNDELISEDIDGLESDVDALDARIDTLEGHSINGVDPNDKMLSIANNLIASTLNVEYDSENKQIKFLGKNDALLGTINTSDFVIDGMISSVGVVEEGGVKYLRFVFNTDAGKQDIDIELSDLVTEYTIAEDSKPYLYISGFTIGAKVNTTDRSGLATENDIHDLQDIIGDGFNTETEQHTLTQKIRHIEEVLEDMPTATELDEAIEDIAKIKDVIAVQLKTKVVEPSANLKLSFFGFPSSEYIMVGERIQPVINVNYTDGKYISANGSETLAGCAVNPNSEKTLKLNGEVIGTLGINQESPAITIQDGEYTASASVNYLEGTTIPTDAFGEPNESIRIPAGTIECETEKVIKAFRPVYYGPFDPSQYAEVNATTINNMITNGVFIPLTKYAWGEKEYITVPDGTKAFAVIVPSDGDRFVGGEVRAILDNKDHGFNIIDQFDKFNLPNVRTYTGDSVGYAYVAYVYQPATEMEESYFKVIY